MRPKAKGNNMKYLFVFPLFFLCGCLGAKMDQNFDVAAQVSRRSYDDSKGIQILVYPIDKEPGKSSE